MASVKFAAMKFAAMKSASHAGVVYGPALAALSCFALLISGCGAPPPPQFRANLVDMKVQGVNPTPDLDILAPDAPAATVAAEERGKVVEEVFGLRLADDAREPRVVSVTADKPAAGGGVLDGDVIRKIIIVDPDKHPDGKPEEPLETTYDVSTREEFYSTLLDKVMWGKQFKIGVFRNQKQQIADLLLALFGTPDDPNPANLDPSRTKASGEPLENPVAGRSLVESYGFNLDKLVVAAGPVRELNGRQHGLYRLHCAYCHGITGDGAGPSAVFLNPYPRDYRQGKFKFKSTANPGKPTRADLLRVLTEGIPGTAMPSFRLLPENERDALVEYVQYLSVRGETERRLILMAAEPRALPSAAALVANIPSKENESPDIGEENIVAAVIQSWREADANIIAPVKPPEGFDTWVTYTPENLRSRNAPPPLLDSTQEKLRRESLARGRHLFYSDLAKCYTCHGDSQLGDGETTDYDDWFKWRKDLNEKPFAEQQKVTAEMEQLGSLPPRHIRPRDLRMGVYRGGRRPLDIYRRIFTGIEGVPMPGLNPPETPEGLKPDPNVLTREDIWHIVHYVLSLPYEPLSEPPRESLEKLEGRQPRQNESTQHEPTQHDSTQHQAERDAHRG